MQIQIRCVDQDGNIIRTFVAEALPLYPRLPAPDDCRVVLVESDFERLKKAFLRFSRAIEARREVGDIGLSFQNGQPFATKRPHLSSVKLLALEMRPFFLEKDSLSFMKLLALRSLGGVEGLRPCLKRHRLRWENSAFEGRMTLAIDEKTLNTTSVVRAWFNDDFFHSESERGDELSLGELKSSMGGEDQAVCLLTHHMIESLRVIGEFFQDVYQASEVFAEWAATVPGWEKPEA
ncbi:hypothetical protein D3C81_744210 [compost metagenome]